MSVLLDRHKKNNDPRAVLLGLFTVAAPQSDAKRCECRDVIGMTLSPGADTEKPKAYPIAAKHLISLQHVTTVVKLQRSLRHSFNNQDDNRQAQTRTAVIL